MFNVSEPAVIFLAVISAVAGGNNLSSTFQAENLSGTNGCARL